MTETEKTFQVSLEQIEGYAYTVRFDWSHVDPVVIDEPKPLGGRRGPNASRLVGAAVGHCLSASLLFCLEKAKQQVRNIATDVTGIMQRNDKGRWRIGRLDVRLTLDVASDQPERVRRCLALFEEYCVVTGSVRSGIEVDVTVVDTSGGELYRSAADGP
jgi:uncharacterized OsmC-like protein